MVRRLISFSVLLISCWSSIGLAAIQEHTFSITGNNGETGTGSFTWDDAVVTDGSTLAASSISLPAELLSIEITLSGGNVVGGSTTFTRSDCTGAALDQTPDFLLDINFWCDNGTNDLVGVSPYTNSMNSGASTLTFAPGSTAPVVTSPPTKVPTLSFWALMLLAGLLALVASRRLPTR